MIPDAEFHFDDDECEPVATPRWFVVLWVAYVVAIMASVVLGILGMSQ